MCKLVLSQLPARWSISYCTMSTSFVWHVIVITDVKQRATQLKYKSTVSGIHHFGNCLPDVMLLLACLLEQTTLPLTSVMLTGLMYVSYLPIKCQSSPSSVIPIYWFEQNMSSRLLKCHLWRDILKSNHLYYDWNHLALSFLHLPMNRN